MSFNEPYDGDLKSLLITVELVDVVLAESAAVQRRKLSQLQRRADG